jgi:hypothetical protein
MTGVYVDGADLRPCRPCEAFAASAERLTERDVSVTAPLGSIPTIQRATGTVQWPPESLAAIYTQSRPVSVPTCPQHERWTRWPISLHTALYREAQDLSLPPPSVESTIEAVLRRKREREMGGRIARRHGYGSRPGQSIEVLIAAYREAGSFEGAARLLDERKVRTWKGGHWYGSTVRSLIAGYV